MQVRALAKMLANRQTHFKICSTKLYPSCYERHKIPAAVVVSALTDATCWVVICCCWVPPVCWEVSGTCWKVDACCCCRSWQWTFLVIASVTNRIIDRYWVVITVTVIVANFCKKDNSKRKLSSSAKNRLTYFVPCHKDLLLYSFILILCDDYCVTECSKAWSLHFLITSTW